MEQRQQAPKITLFVLTSRDTVNLELSWLISTPDFELEGPAREELSFK